MHPHTLRGLALFAALQATFSDIHPLCDQIIQNIDDATDKAKPGWDGRAACARHVTTYTIGQLVAAVAVTRVLGYRIPLGSLAAGMTLNAATHFAIDRRTPLLRVLRSRWINSGAYLDHATVQRRPGVIDQSGPGTALLECDQAAHRLIGVLASLVTTWLAMRGDRRA